MEKEEKIRIFRDFLKSHYDLTDEEAINVINQFEFPEKEVKEYKEIKEIINDNLGSRYDYVLERDFYTLLNNFSAGILYQGEIIQENEKGYFKQVFDDCCDNILKYLEDTYGITLSTINGLTDEEDYESESVVEFLTKVAKDCFNTKIKTTRAAIDFYNYVLVKKIMISNDTFTNEYYEYVNFAFETKDEDQVNFGHRDVFKDLNDKWYYDEVNLVMTDLYDDDLDFLNSYLEDWKYYGYFDPITRDVYAFNINNIEKILYENN